MGNVFGRSTSGIPISAAWREEPWQHQFQKPCFNFSRNPSPSGVFFKEIIIEIELELVLPFCPSFIPVFVSGPWKRMMTCQATFVSVVPHPRKEQLHGGVFGPEGGVISPAAYFLGIILLVRG